MIEGLIRRMMETRILKDKDYGGDTLYPEKVRIRQGLWRTLCIVRSLLYWCLGQQRYKLVIIMYT
jgi:hypothetical protein